VVIVVMGVSGAGKTTVGRALAPQLGWMFADGDDYHSAANVEKMRHGIPLTDLDRETWLESLGWLIKSWLEKKVNAVLACSALKHAYREKLRVGTEVKFVYLRGTAELLRQRLRERHGHFMTEKMLDSQFATLEEPHDAVVVDIDKSPEEIVRDIRARLELVGDGC